MSRVRSIANTERDRLAVLGGLGDLWRPFLSAWSTSAAFLARCGHGELPLTRYQENTTDQNLAWAWEAVDPYIDATLHTIDVRCCLSSGVTFQVFEVLRGAALVLPDGSALPILREFSEQHARVESSALLARSAMNAWRVNRAMAASESDQQKREARQLKPDAAKKGKAAP